MKSAFFVCCLLLTSLLSQSQWTTGTNLIYFNGGNVGIGTAVPDHKLHVEGSTYINGDFRLGQPETGYGRGIWFGTSTTNTDPFVLIRYNPGADQSELRMFLGDDGGDRITFGRYTGTWAPTSSITASGQMSLGTLTIPAGYKLAVAGNIIAEKVRVSLQSNWPDYVFDASYHLPSLHKVEQFIRQHKHLLDVPSAKEVEKIGIELGDNQAILLKKIEELTLYVIEQNKKLEEQHQRILKLEAANEQLRLGNKVRKTKRN